MYWQQNPLNNRRRNFLKTDLTRRYPHFSSEHLGSILDAFAATDPTQSGAYAGWLLNLYRRGKFIIPEDVEKFRTSLELFHRIKHLLPRDSRDINRLGSFGELFRLLEESGHSESKRQALNTAITMGQEQVVWQPPYEVRRVTTPEAAAELAKNSGWCVVNLDTAKYYLHQGPLYFVFIEGVPEVLVHGESRQITNRSDDPVSGELAQILPDLFLREFLPDLVHCGRAVQEICASCDEMSMYCSCQSGCICDDCREGTCPFCSKTCDLCNASLCEYCHKECEECGDGVCRRCRDRGCSHGDGEHITCDGCASECDECGTPTCAQHIVTCYACSNEFCPDCVNSCDYCSSEVCDDCSSVECTACGMTSSCESCLQECEVCGNRVCGGCLGVCEKCEKDACDTCFTGDFCDACGGSDNEEA